MNNVTTVITCMMQVQLGEYRPPHLHYQWLFCRLVDEVKEVPPALEPPK
jgi:hypothetical protein